MLTLTKNTMAIFGDLKYIFGDLYIHGVIFLDIFEWEEVASCFLQNW